ncbi:MAG: hypothetical protein ABW250_27865 [Pyrinomonadaceae bacterium]
MRVNPYLVAALLMCGLLTLASYPDGFGQRKGGHPPTTKPPPRGPDKRFPPGRVRIDDCQRTPFGPRADFLSDELRFGDRLVKGAPFFARFAAESRQTLGDGTHVTCQSTGAVYRNAEGRTRREMTLYADGPGAAVGVGRRVVLIIDFAAGLHYLLEDDNRAALKAPLLYAPPEPPPAPAGKKEKASIRTESLGRLVLMEGVTAEGTRTVLTVPNGEIVSERWFSPELQVIVMSRQSNPSVGEKVYRLTDITLVEPAPTLFEIPAGYGVVDGDEPRILPSRPRE